MVDGETLEPPELLAPGETCLRVGGHRREELGVPPADGRRPPRCPTAWRRRTGGRSTAAGSAAPRDRRRPGRASGRSAPRARRARRRRRAGSRRRRTPPPSARTCRGRRRAVGTVAARSGSSMRWLHSSVASRVRWRSGAVRLVWRSTLASRSSRSAIWATDSTGTRAAASSIGSGIPSSHRQIRRIVSRTPGASGSNRLDASAARSMNSDTAPSSGSSLAGVLVNSVRFGDREAADAPHLLAGYAERLAARRDDPERLGALEQRDDQLRATVDHLLAVVEHQQSRFGEPVGERGRRGIAGQLALEHGGRHHLGHQIGDRASRQVDPPSSSDEVRSHRIRERRSPGASFPRRRARPRSELGCAKPATEARPTQYLAPRVWSASPADSRAPLRSAVSSGLAFPRSVGGFLDQ